MNWKPRRGEKKTNENETNSVNAKTDKWHQVMKGRTNNAVRLHCCPQEPQRPVGSLHLEPRSAEERPSAETRGWYADDSYTNSALETLEWSRRRRRSLPLHPEALQRDFGRCRRKRPTAHAGAHHSADTRERHDRLSSAWSSAASSLSLWTSQMEPRLNR